MKQNRIKQIVRESLYRAINEGTTSDDTFEK